MDSLKHNDRLSRHANRRRVFRQVSGLEASFAKEVTIIFFQSRALLYGNLSFRLVLPDELLVT